MLMRVSIYMVYAVSIEVARTAYDAVYLVTLLQEELGKVRAILSRNSGN